MSEVFDAELLRRARQEVEYRLVSPEGGVRERFGGENYLRVPPAALSALARAAFKDLAFYLRPAHLRQLGAILQDAEASANDRYVATELLRNACVAAGGVLPMCQDTGTALVHAQRGMRVLSDGQDALHLSQGIRAAYTEENLRYSQLAPLSLFEERNTGDNLPAQIDLLATPGEGYEFLFMAKGCGSANKTLLFQKTPAVLQPHALKEFLLQEILALGTSACPPYHLAVVVGGTSADFALRTARLASAKYLEGLPGSGTPQGTAFRDRELEQELLAATRGFGLGAQFGGKYFCYDVQVIRLPRHAGSCPVALAVSCAADRHALGRITTEGVFLEQLERDPAQYLPEPEFSREPAVAIDLDRPLAETRAALGAVPVGTRVQLSGTLVVARDQAHARLKQKLDRGEALPRWFTEHPIFYAGPAKTPPGHASGSLGATTAGRMDSYVEQFHAAGGSLVSLAKGNRSPAVARSCREHGGFYLGTIGGPAALLAADCIREMEVIDYADLGMEAVYRLRVQDFPAFVVVNDRGEDFFANLTRPVRFGAAAGPARPGPRTAPRRASSP